MSEKLIYYAHYGSSHLRRRGCRARKQILSGQETPQLKANVIMGGPGGHFYTSLKVQAVQIVIVADMRRSCQVWQVRGRFSTCFLDYICFSTRTSGHEGAKTLCSYVLFFRHHPCLAVLSTAAVFPLLLNKAALHLWHVGAEYYWSVIGKWLD